MSISEWFLLALLLGGIIFMLRAGRRASSPAPAKTEKRSSTPKRSGPIPKEARHAGAAFVEVVIPGKLEVLIYKTTLTAPDGPIDCWVYVSDGLWEVGQKEFVFVVACRPDEADEEYPRDLPGLLGTIHHFAEEGRFVDVGDYTLLGPRTPLLGREDFLGIIYAPPQPLTGVRIKKPWLLAIITTANEHQVARELGAVRVLSALGKRYRYFPTAPWADRDREELCSPEQMKESFIAKAPSMLVPEASVRLTSSVVSQQDKAGPAGLRDKSIEFGRSVVELRLRKAAARRMEAFKNLPATKPFAFRVSPDPGAEACFAWEPGQTSPSAIAMPHSNGSIVAGNFIMFAPLDAEETRATIEDGFFFGLRQDDLQRVREALRGEKDLSLPAREAGLHDLVIRWEPDLDLDYVNPNASRVPGGWAAFPPGKKTSFEGRLDLTSVSLLTLEQIMALRVPSSEELGGYITAITEALKAHFADGEEWPTGDMFVECTVRPDETRSFNIDCRPDEPPARALEAILEHLNEIAPPEVLFGPVSFQLNLRTQRAEQRTLH